MIRLNFLVLCLVSLLCGADAVLYSNDPDLALTAAEIVQNFGYPIESYNVTTSDGYILTQWRISHGRNNTATSRRPVVFFMHGLQGSSDGWLMNQPNESAPFIFADAGFDVWLGNSRGNRYSRAHTSLSITSNQYWHFTFSEMINQDLDAMITGALAVSGAQSLYYVGHSQGTLIMFGKLSRDLEFAKKIKKFFALAPVATVSHIKGAMQFLATFGEPALDTYYAFMGDGPQDNSQFLSDLLSRWVCVGNLRTEACEHTILLFMGSSSTQWNDTRVGVYLAHGTGGTSTRNFAQMVRTNRFSDYDYGIFNYYNYGQWSPPAYDVAKIQTDTHLYWSSSDWLADEDDIRQYLLKKLNPSILHNTQLQEFNHLDFLWGMRAADEIYKPILKIISDDQEN